MFWRRLHGTEVMSLALRTRGCRFDPRLLQSVGKDYKLRYRLHMTLAVGWTLNPNSTNQPIMFWMGRVIFLILVVPGQVDFCNISKALILSFQYFKQIYHQLQYSILPQHMYLNLPICKLFSFPSCSSHIMPDKTSFILIKACFLFTTSGKSTYTRVHKI